MNEVTEQSIARISAIKSYIEVLGEYPGSNLQAAKDAIGQAFGDKDPEWIIGRINKKYPITPQSDRLEAFNVFRNIKRGRGRLAHGLEYYQNKAEISARELDQKEAKDIVEQEPVDESLTLFRSIQNMKLSRNNVLQSPIDFVFGDIEGQLRSASVQGRIQASLLSVLPYRDIISADFVARLLFPGEKIEIAKDKIEVAATKLNLRFKDAGLLIQRIRLGKDVVYSVDNLQPSPEKEQPVVAMQDLPVEEDIIVIDEVIPVVEEAPISVVAPVTPPEHITKPTESWAVPLGNGEVIVHSRQQADLISHIKIIAGEQDWISERELLRAVFKRVDKKDAVKLKGLLQEIEGEVKKIGIQVGTRKRKDGVYYGFQKEELDSLPRVTTPKSETADTKGAMEDSGGGSYEMRSKRDFPSGKIRRIEEFTKGQVRPRIQRIIAIVEERFQAGLPKNPNANQLNRHFDWMTMDVIDKFERKGLVTFKHNTNKYFGHAYFDTIDIIAAIYAKEYQEDLVKQLVKGLRMVIVQEWSKHQEEKGQEETGKLDTCA